MPPRRTVAQFAHVSECLDNAFDARMTVFEEQFALARKRRASRSPHEKTRVELRFELLDVAAYRRTANAKPVTRLRETAFAHHGEKRNHAGITRGEAARQGIVAATLQREHMIDRH